MFPALDNINTVIQYTCIRIHKLYYVTLRVTEFTFELLRKVARD